MKLDFESALEMLNDGRMINKSSISQKALNRKVWIAEWHLPGCLSESNNVCTNKKDAIESALFFAESETGYPRGMKSHLQKHGRFDYETDLYGYVITTVSQCRFADLF